MINKEIKEAIKDANLFQWQIADCLNMAESTFYRKMRHILPDAEKQRIFEAIEKLSKEEK